MDKVLNKLTKLLEGLEWFVISGFAVEVYTDGKRKSDDIDLVVSEKDIGVFAKRTNSAIRKRFFTKGSYVVKDTAVETEIFGKSIEATSGYPFIRLKNETFSKLFQKKNRIFYKGARIFVAPIEEIIVLKAIIKREKDINDLILLRNKVYNKELIKELAKDCKKQKQVIEVLNKLDFNIR